MSLIPQKKEKKSSQEKANPLFGKIPPQQLDFEKAILGVLMIESTTVYVAMSKLFPEIFYKEAHQKIFTAIQKLYDTNASIDLLTVTAQLKKTGELEEIGGYYYVTMLTNDVISGAHIEYWIKIVGESYLKREAIRLSSVLTTEAYDDSTDAFDIINMADAGFQKIQEQVLTGMSNSLSDTASKFLEKLAKIKETGIVGIQTGLKSLDKIISGLVAPDLIVIAARPAQGKTALALSITYNTSVLSNVPCAWFTLEMDRHQLFERLVSIDTGIEHKKIRNSLLSDNERQIIYSSTEKISNCPIFIEDNGTVNIRDIRTRANLLKHKHGIKFIVVDYIQLMNGLDTKGKSREQIVSEISRNLKLLAKELEIPVIALSQLNRSVDNRPSKMPQLADLRESGAIEQDADEVIFLMRPEFYRMEEAVILDGKEYDVRGLTIIDTAKNRHGETKNAALHFKGNCMHFTDHPQDTATSFYTAPKNFYDTEKDDSPF
jgi:replicative DNA helicase